MATEDLWIIPLNHAWAVQSDIHGIVEEGFDCRAAAQDFIDERRAAEAEAEAHQHADYMAQQREMDLIYRSVARMYDADKPANDARNFAVREVLDAIDSLGRPTAEDARAA